MPAEQPDNSHSADPTALSPGQKRLLLLLLIAAFTLRLVASVRDGLWLDEIWSLNMAMAVEHWWEVFTKINSTNSHIANTIWLHLLGFQEYWGWYRLPAVLSGFGVIALIAGHPVFGPSRQRLLAVFLMTVSFPLVHFASEARGYAPAMFCGVFGYFCLRQYWDKKSLKYLLGLHAAIILGLLWHLTFVFIYAALAAWILWRIVRETSANTERGLQLIKLLLPNSLFAAGLYFGYMRKLVNEGGSEITLKQMLFEVFGMALGGPAIGWPALLSVVIVLSVIVAGVIRQFRQGSDEWIFRLVVLLLAPVLLTLVQNSGAVYYRFFVICFPFFYLLLAEQIDLAWRSSSLKRTLATLLLVAITCVQTGRTAHFLKYGRGDYLHAVLFMAANSSSEQLHLGSDHDFRNKMILFYYQFFLPKEKPLVYHDWNTWPKDGVDWVIGHLHEPKPQFIRDGFVYRWEKTYRHFGGDAGTTWHLYRKIGPANVTPPTAGPQP
jgi:hypothetical protein